MSEQRVLRFAELFAGAGGLSMGLERAGWSCAWHAEIADAPRAILSHRWPDVPLYGDVTTIDGRELAQKFDAAGETSTAERLRALISDDKQTVVRAASGADAGDERWSAAADAEWVAERFHEIYERLAPSHGYRTRTESARPWADVPEANRALMVATSRELLVQLLARLRARDAGQAGTAASDTVIANAARRFIAASDAAFEYDGETRNNPEWQRIANDAGEASKALRAIVHSVPPAASEGGMEPTCAAPSTPAPETEQ